jgi:hypothetical protein
VKAEGTAKVRAGGGAGQRGLVTDAVVQIGPRSKPTVSVPRVKVLPSAKAKRGHEHRTARTRR